MVHISNELSEALESDCGHSLEDVIDRKAPEDFRALQNFLSMDPTINSQQRIKALHLLGRWGDPVAVPTIVQILPDLDEVGRSRAIEALGRLDSSDGFAAILEHVNDPSPNVRKFVVNALGKTSQPGAQKKLKEIEDKDTEAFVRDLARKFRVRKGRN